MCAWIRAMGEPSKSALKDIIKDGILNSAYFLSGNGSQQTTYVLFDRQGANDVWGYINTVNFDNINSISYSLELSNNSMGIKIKVDNNILWESGTGHANVNLSGTINTTSITGSHQITFEIYSYPGNCKVYQFIGA